MWTLVDEPGDPEAFFACVLPVEREIYQPQYGRAYAALQQGRFDREASVWAMEGREPIGVMLVVGEQPELLVAVREEWRGRGVAADLVEKSCAVLREKGVHALLAAGVSSANVAGVGLLQATGFIASATGSLRMRRSLDAPLPACDIAPGYVLRTLDAGEEAAYVRLKNACFPESRSWTDRDFALEFASDNFVANERIFVAECEGHLVGTACAWETDHGDGPIGLVHWVGVDPAHRGHGIGETLSARVLHELAAWGYLDAWLNTSRDRVAAVRLYERLGFALHGEVYNYALALH